LVIHYGLFGWSDGSGLKVGICTLFGGVDGFSEISVKRERVVTWYAIAAQVVRRDGEILYSGTAGQRDPSAPDLIQANTTLFRLASMTKPITASGTCSGTCRVCPTACTARTPCSRSCRGSWAGSPGRQRHGLARIAGLPLSTRDDNLSCNAHIGHIQFRA
jgi:hypothetical protein